MGTACRSHQRQPLAVNENIILESSGSECRQPVNKTRDNNNSNTQQVNTCNTVDHDDPKEIKVNHVFSAGDQVIGVTLFGGKLFVVRSPTNQRLEVYSIDTWQNIPHINVQALGNYSWGITATCDSIYVGTWGVANKIHRISDDDDDDDNDDAGFHVVTWDVDMMPTGLAAQRSNLLVTLWSMQYAVREYTRTGSIVREVLLDSSVVQPWQTLKLSNDLFLVCHGDQNSLHRVCHVNTSGQIVRSTGNDPGSNAGRFNEPRALSATASGNRILVADSVNNRVIVLDGSLKWIGDVTLRKHGGLQRPSVIHLDETKDRLYVGEISGRVLVINDVIKAFGC